MSTRFIAALLIVALPAAAEAQATREGNIYNGVDHQPTQGVITQEQHAGVAPSPGQLQNEDRTLNQLDSRLLNKAHQDARKNPQALSNPYGVQNGNAVKISPDAEGTRGGGGG
jgi:hypothetical protein